MRRLIGSVCVSLTTAALAAVLLAPAAGASPIGDAEAAIMAAWDKAGGDGSPLGARKGDVYPVADGFACDFDGGKMFFTPATGAKFMYGPILDKYESLGGPVSSDLGFPAINEVPGLAGPDSRVSTFSASDKPVIYWTPEHGAFVVRGAINSAWDKLGSSGGVLGVPVGDETYSGEVSSQKFSGGQVSWNRETKQFTTDPPALADQLKGLQVAIDPTVAINMAWRAAGGAGGPLGAKQGAQYPVGGDGIVQNFAGGKVFFNPATGANAIENDILGKYEQLGGPAGSGLGFPVANESDGGLPPSSRIATFSAADKPVIFWTSDHGAFVVRGAMKAAWDKLRGPTGKLGAPVADQTVDGDVITQQFSGGKVSWNRAKNTFSTEPANLAPLLSGLQISGQNQPSGSVLPPSAKKAEWNWWWLLAGVPVLVLLVVSAVLAVGWRRRRRAAPVGAGYAPGYDGADPHWGPEDAPDEHYALGAPQDAEPARVGWRRGGFGDDDYGRDDEDPDAVDTDHFPVPSEAMLAQAGYDEGYGQADYDQAGYAEDPFDEAGYPDEAREPDDHSDQHADPDADEYADQYGDEYADVVPEDAVGEPGEYLDAAEPSAPHDADYADGPAATADQGSSHGGAPPEAVAAGAAAASGGARRAGRHAAADTDDDVNGSRPAASGRPTIHLPLDDPYQVPDGYPIKASARFGLYYTPGSDLYQDTLAEIWLASEEVAEANGFTRAD